MSVSRIVRTSVAVGLVVAGIAAGATGAGAAITPTCTLEALTDLPAGGNLEHLDISGDGSTVAFSTDAAYGGNTSGNEEVFAVDTATGVVTPVTAIGGSTLDSSEPSLDHDGDRVALLSEAQQSGSNPENNQEVYVGTEVGGVWGFDAVTTTPAGADQDAPRISGDGTRMVFRSNANTTADNADGNDEMWVWIQGDPQPLEQITESTGGAHDVADAAISADGRLVAFSSDAADGNGPASTQVRLISRQLTSSNDERHVAPPDEDFAYFPSVSRSGEVIAFQAPSDLGSPSTNADGNLEIWRTHLGTSYFTDAVTATPAGAADINVRASTNDAGSVVVFESTHPSFVGSGGGGEGVVRWAETGGFTTVLPRVGADPIPQASGIGNVVALRFDDPGDGSDDVFLSRCRTFADVSTFHPFWDDVEWMAAERVTTGYADGTFRPSNAVSRGAMAAFLFRLSGSPLPPVPATAPFSDVPLSHPFVQEIYWVSDYGIADGYTDGTFRPAASVTRQSMSAFMHRMSGTPAGPFPDPGFSDVSATHPFHDQIWWMAQEGITTGYDDGSYRPSTAVSRQAMSAFMRRLFEGPGVHI